MTTGCYLLHYHEPYPAEKERHPRRHYLGSANDIERRINDHRAGRGARMPAVMASLGIGFVVARTWESDDHRTLEKSLKRARNHARLCPVCSDVARGGQGATLKAPDVGTDCPDMLGALPGPTGELASGCVR